LARFTRTARAEEDLIEIWLYVAEHNPNAADRLLDKISLVCERLAEHPPALRPLACWPVEQRDGKLFVTTKKEASKRSSAAPAAGTPERIVIIGGGAAGFAAAERLRREQYQGSLMLRVRVIQRTQEVFGRTLSNDDAPPVDRPNLSKDYLAGNAPEDWVRCAQRASILKTISSCTSTRA
jgi:ParE toxin of type II toxin-antitoxin system, parDE/NAD(P)-binding Rossmann-like domain